MNVGDDRKSAPPADLPQCSKVTAIEADDTGLQAFRIEVVVEHELSNPRPPCPAMAEQKCPAFVLAMVSPLSETIEKPAPKQPGAGKFLLRCAEAAHSLGN